MAEIPPALTAFRGVRDLTPDTRLGLGEGNKVRESGKQERVNIFARAWDFLTRSPEVVESNKQVAREFVRGLKETYGSEVAGMASRELKGQLSQGRPLTAYRVERMLAKSEAMAGAIEAGNRNVLGRALDRIESSSVQRAFGEVNDSVLTREERLEAIQRGIENDPAFKEVSFHTIMHVLVEELLLGGTEDLAPLDHTFIDKFVPVATRALERAAEQKLMPNTLAIIERDGDSGSGVRDEMLVYTPRRLGLDNDQAMTFAMVSTQFRSITDSLVGGHSPLGVVLGQIGLLRDQISDKSENDEPRIRDFDLKGPAGEYRDALLQDMRALEHTLGESIGFDTLPPNGQQALLDGYIRGCGISDSVAEGSLQRLRDSAPEDLAKLREDLEVMNQLDPQDEKSRSLLEVVRGQAEKAIALLEVGTAFGRGDLERLRELNLPVAETLARFTPDEAGLLHEAGIGIELGLQYKDRGVPIHPRTLALEFTGERVVGEPRLLGGGALSKPYEVNYGDRVMVFKEAKPGAGYGPQSERLGIDKNDSRMAVRNLATKVVDELLEFGIVPETAFGTKDGQLGIVMDFAHGASPSKYHSIDITNESSGENILSMMERYSDVPGDEKQSRINAEQRQMILDASRASIDNGRVLQLQDFGVAELKFTDAKLRQELVKLQLLDALTAQGDRHSGNYVVELGSNSEFKRLHAIDNDQAFGPKLTDPNQLLHKPPSPFNGVRLPKVVDREMKETFDQLTPDRLRAGLHGLLPETEIGAAIARLEKIQSHMAVLESQGMVIQSNDWGSAKAGNALESDKDSYVGRESGYVGRLPTKPYAEEKS